MSESKHTPGPWEAIHYAGTDAYSDVVAGRVALVDGSHSNPLLSPEDARLIAAAPDMFEALRDIASYYDPSFGDYANTLATKAQKALAKASGEQTES